jgi:radical SAM protein with 4Fe4S-binding SPASM domain
LAITPEGEVIGCIMMRKPIFGRLPSQKLIEVLRGDSFIELSMITNGKIDGCSVCEYRYACFDCRPAAISNSENLLEKPDCGYDPRMPLKKRVSYANEK